VPGTGAGGRCAAVSTWRPAPGDRSTRGATPVGASLAGEVRRLGGPDAAVVRQVFGHWGDLVGPAVAARSRPRTLRDGVLTVEVEDPAWATQLRWLQAQVLARIGEVAPGAAVTELVVRVTGQRPPRQAPAGGPPKRRR
jgi:predicted nucleic acid-binding Zn ribbon protein